MLLGGDWVLLERREAEKTSRLGPKAWLLHATDLCFFCTGQEFVQSFIFTSVIRHISNACIYTEKQISENQKRSLAQKPRGTDKLVCTLLTASLFYGKLPCS